MSLNTRYIVLTLIFLVFLILFSLMPTFTGLVTDKEHAQTLDCENTSDYDHCVQCCQDNANNMYGKEYYGTDTWNSEYDGCWTNYCMKYSK